MSDAVIFAIVFAGLFILRIIAATVVFFFILPEGDRCPNCDAVTLRLESTGRRAAFRWFPWFRPSWCYECGWEGVLRRGPLSPRTSAPEPVRKT
jgi:hypothetical protein